MKQRTHAASGVLLASLALHYTSHNVLLVLCWAVTWSIISDFDVYVPTIDHRGITHTLAFALLSGALVLMLGKSPSTPFYALLASLSVIMHLVLDSLTPSGVPLWMPFSRKRVRFPIIGGKIRYDNRAVNMIIQAIAIGAAILISIQ